MLTQASSLPLLSVATIEPVYLPYTQHVNKHSEKKSLNVHTIEQLCSKGLCLIHPVVKHDNAIIETEIRTYSISTCELMESLQHALNISSQRPL